MGNIVAHESLRIVLFDGASIVPAYLNNGATMDGTRQFVRYISYCGLDVLVT